MWETGIGLDVDGTKLLAPYSFRGMKGAGQSSLQGVSTLSPAVFGHNMSSKMSSLEKNLPTVARNAESRGVV